MFLFWDENKYGLEQHKHAYRMLYIFFALSNIAFDYWSSGEFSIENKYVNHSIKSNIPRFAWSNVLTVVIKRVTTHRCCTTTNIYS